MPLLRLTVLSSAAALIFAAAAFATLTPSAYRAQANAICAHGIDQVFATATPPIGASDAQRAKAYARTLAIARQEYAALDALKPPAALIDAHRHALWAKWYVLKASAKIVKLPGGGTGHDQATHAAWFSYATLFGRESQAWAAVGGVKQCQAG